MSYGQTASEVHLMYHTIISTLQTVESRRFSVMIFTDKSQPRAFQVTHIFTDVMFLVLCLEMKAKHWWPLAGFAVPPTPLGEFREMKIIQKPCAEGKSSFSEPNCHWFVWHGHISGRGFCLWLLQEMKILFSTSSSHLWSVKISQICRFQGKGIQEALCIGCYVIIGTILIWWCL